MRCSRVLAPPPPLPGVPPSIDVAFRVAETESPTLWQAILNERAGRARIAAERAERNPIVSADAAIGINNPNGVGFGGLERGASAYLARVQVLLAGLLPACEGAKGELLRYGTPAVGQEFQPALELAKPGARFGLLLVGGSGGAV